MKKLETLFHEALAQPVDSRVAWVIDQCDDEPALRDELLALLKSDDTPDPIRVVERELAGMLRELPGPGAAVDHYVIKRRIADGGMGTVFEATDTRLGRPAALKFLHPHRALDERAAGRFLDEARAISRLNHPNVCTIYSIAEHQRGQQYIAMEYCDGQSLADAIARNALTHATIADILRQLATTLAALHGAGIVHRDLKPGNIMLGDDLRIKLLDFGLAADAASVDSGEAMGTIAYMAPEQFRSDAVDHRIDLWAFGVICHVLVTGAPPFQAESIAEVMHLIVNARNPGQGLPRALARLINACLQPELAKRVPDAGELVALVDDVGASYAGPEGDEKPLYRLADDPVATTTSQLARRSMTAVAVKLTFDPDVDIEDRSAIRDDMQQLFAAVCQRFDARIERGAGTATFGYPVTDELTVPLAVRCALAVAEAVDRRQTDDRGPAHRFTCGVGVHTGMTVVRRETGEVDPFGDLTDDARHLAGLAGGTVLASAATADVVRDQFSFGERQPSGAVPVLFELHPADRFDNEAGLSPFIGRTHELGILNDAWLDALEGHGRVVAVTAEPGLGKSRLVHELKGTIRKQHDAWFVDCICSPFESDTALFPVSNYLARDVLGLDAAMTPEERRRRVRGLAAEYNLPDDDLPVLYRLFGVDDPDGTSAPGGEQLRARTRACLLELLRKRSLAQPVLAVFEDLHWADPTTNEFIEYLLTQPQLPNVMIVLTFRPRYQADWLQQTHVTQLVLNALNLRDSQTLARHLTGDELSEDQYRQLMDHADGNPLYIEELARSPMGDSIPATLHDSLIARLEAQGDSARLTAQIASVIGREFSLRLITAISAQPAAVTERLLTQLVRADIVHIDRDHSANAPDRRYRFKHALVRDAAYATLLVADREHYHRAIARVLAREPLADPGVLARHLIAGRQFADATVASLTAARRAQAEFALQETVTHCQNALDSLTRCPPEAADPRLKLDAYQMLGPALMATKGYADPMVDQTCRRALELADQLGDAASAFPMSFGLWTYHCVSAHHDLALALADTLVSMADQSGSSDFRVEAHMVRGISHFFRGEWPTTTWAWRSNITTRWRMQTTRRSSGRTH